MVYLFLMLNSYPGKLNSHAVIIFEQPAYRPCKYNHRAKTSLLIVKRFLHELHGLLMINAKKIFL